jgi:hypothetical protein
MNTEESSTANTLTLRRRASSWTVQWEGPMASVIRSLFGTDEIPTAYTALADADTVRAAIARLNPNDIVFVAGPAE